MGTCCSDSSRDSSEIKGTLRDTAHKREALRDLDYPSISDFDEIDSKPTGTEKLQDYLSTPNPPNKTSRNNSPENMILSNLMNQEGNTAKAAIDLYCKEKLKDKSNILGPYSYVDSSTYKGQYEKGQRSRFGKAVYLDGSVYLGEWKNDLKWGKGVFAFDTGEVYIGDFFQDYANGKGKKVF